MAELSHDEIWADLSAYVDGELQAERAEQVEAHLQQCAECEAKLTELRRLRAVLRGMAAEHAPPDFIPRVQRTIEARSRGRFFGRSGGGTRLPYEAVGVIMLVVLAALLLVGLGQERAVPLGWDRPPLAKPDGGTSEGSWGDPEGVLYRIEIEATASAAEARRVVGEVASEARLAAPRREADLLAFRVPVDRLEGFLSTMAARLPLRVQRLPMQAPLTGAAFPEVPVEVALPR